MLGRAAAGEVGRVLILNTLAPVFLLIALGVFLPLFGASALLVLTAETLILSRLPGVRNWLGLRS